METGSAIASSSFATELIRGMTLDQAAQVTNKTISKELALPPVKLHCSMLAEDAITVSFTLSHMTMHDADYLVSFPSLLSRTTDQSEARLPCSHRRRLPLSRPQPLKHVDCFHFYGSVYLSDYIYSSKYANLDRCLAIPLRASRQALCNE